MSAASARPVRSNVFLLEKTTSTGHRYSIHLAQTIVRHTTFGARTEVCEFSSKVFSGKGEEDKVE